jgi:sugar lactone lactonase YvrE
LAALLLFALASSLHAQSGTPFVYPLTLTPDYYPTYNDAIGASVLVRDENTDAPLSGTVNFTVDGGPAIAATLNSNGLAYANLGQLSIATHTVKATYLGNAQYSGGSISGTIQIGDAPLTFVGTQGTTMFGSGSVGDVEGVAVDAQDNLYVSERSAAKIFKEDTLGNVTTIPVTGLKSPVGMALDSAGNLYIADATTNQIVEYSASGVQTVVPTTKLSAPTYLAYDRKNDILYIADTGNNRVESYTPATKASADVATGMTALRGVSVDSLGNIYFSDRNAGFVQINSFFGLSNLQIPIYAPVVEPGSIAAGIYPYVIVTDLSTNAVFRYDNNTNVPDQGSQVQINNGQNPVVDVATDSTGRVYMAVGGRVDVVDTGSGRAPDVGVNPPNGEGNSFFSLIFQTPQAKPSFTVTTSPSTTFNQFGSITCTGTAGACFAQGYFVPQFAGVNTGSMSVTTTYDIGDVPLWGKGIGGGAAFTPGTISQSSSGASTIGGVAFDAAGNRYVTDTTNNTVTEFSPSGTKTALAFTGLSKPTQISIDGLGAVYVLDSGNQRIERLSADGVQSDEYEASDQADFASITAFSLDGDSNLLLAGLPGNPDTDVRKKTRVTRKDSESTGSYVIGIEGHYFPPDGKKVDISYPFEHIGQVAANLPEVTGVAIDAEENIFAVDTSGTLTRFGIDGTTKQLATGLGTPLGLALDPSGTAYVLGTTSITTIQPDGTKSSIAVNGLYSAAAFALDPYGDIVIGDAPDKQLIYLDRTQQNYVFGDVNVGQSETIDGSIGNIGNQPFTVAYGLPANGIFAQTGTANACAAPGASTDGTTIAPGGECDLDYIFTPTSNGPVTLSGTLITTPQTLVGSDGGGVITLTGTGEGSSTAAPDPVLTPATINFGSLQVGTTSPAQTATLKNAGNATLTISSFGFFGPDFVDFNQTNNCGSTLAAGASCSIKITCTPGQPDPLSANLGANFPSPLAQQSIALSCTGTPIPPAQAVLTPATANFGNVAVGTTSAAQVFTLSNPGGSALDITGINIMYGNGSPFAVASKTCTNNLDPGKSCTISVTFSPTATGAATANLEVEDYLNNSPQTSALSGTGTAGTAPIAALTPANNYFGSFAIGSTSAAQTFTLTNSGTAALSVTSISLTGANAAEFAIASKTCGSSVAAGASCTIAVTFSPTSTGTSQAILSVTDNANGSPQSSTISGNGTAAAAPAATLTPANLDFGSVETGTKSTAQNATLTNTGNAALAISGITLTGTNSSAFTTTTTCGSSLAAGASCTVSVIFDPTVAATDTASLSVSDNAAGSPQTTSLTGIGTAPPPMADFSIAATPASQTVASGSSAVYQVAIGSVNGSFTTAVSLSASGVPAGATVVFSPTSVTPGSAGGSSTMTIQTAAQQTSAQASNHTSRWPLPAGLVSAALLILPFRRRKRIFSALASLLLLVAAGGALTACGGGFALPHQPSTTYTVTVSGASGSLQHSTSVQITVR